MVGILELLSGFVASSGAWGYFIIALGFHAQGELTVFTSVYLLVNKRIDFSIFIIVMILSLFVYDVLLYSLGRFLKDSRLGRYLEKKIPHYTKIQFHFHKNADLFLIISKFATYFNSGVLLLSGWSEMNYAKFLKHRLIANLAWASLYLTLSYFVVSFLSLARGLKILPKIEIAVFTLVLAIIIATKHVLKRTLEKEAEIEEKAEKIGKRVERFSK